MRKLNRASPVFWFLILFFFIANIEPVLISADAAHQKSASKVTRVEHQKAKPKLAQKPKRRQWTGCGNAAIPKELRGSKESRIAQNKRMRDDGVKPVKTFAELERLKSEGGLVRLPEADYLKIDPRLEERRRYVRPDARNFLFDLGKDFFNFSRNPLQQNSAIRSEEDQKKIKKHNGNAAPVSGDDASLHLTGLAIDITKIGMTNAELKWMRNHLIKLKAAGLIDVAEESCQWVFHIVVFKEYKKPDN